MDQIRVVDTNTMAWESGLDVVNHMTEEFRKNLGPAEKLEQTYSKYWQKTLSVDPISTRRIDLIRLEPGYADLTYAYHDSVEECLFLEGDCTLGGEGEFYAGDYFWRPPGWVHTASTRSGFLALLSLEGKSPESGPTSRRIRPDEMAGKNGIWRDDQDEIAMGPRGWVKRLEVKLAVWQRGPVFARCEGPLGDCDLDRVSFKVLSKNPELGRQSLLVRLAPGFQQSGSGSFTASHEFYVLEGELTLGATELCQGCYVNRPAGAVAGPMASAAGATLFMKSDGWLGYERK